MTRWKRMVKKVLFPRLWVILLGAILGTAGLIYVFAGEHQNTWAAYTIYLFSAYILTVACVRICRSGKYARQNANALMERVPVVQRYLNDVSFNMHVTLYRSLALNVIYAILKFAFSVYYRSIWFGTLAVYYFLLAITRFALIHYASRNSFGEHLKAEWKRYRLCGGILLVMNLALTGVVIMAVQDHAGFYYPGYLIYVVAMYAFYSMTTAVINLVKYRRYHSPVMSAAKVLHLAAALVSMLALETAMLAQFNGNDREDFRILMTGCTGGAVCAIILAAAIFMIFHATRHIQLIQQEERT